MEFLMILDNYGTHTHDNVVAWLDKHPRFHLHFIPTSSSWLNMVERWFRELTEKAIRRGVFKSVPDLIAAIEAYLQASNNDPKPCSYGPPRQRRSSRKSAEAGSHSHQSRLITRHHTRYRRVPRGRPGTRPGFSLASPGRDPAQRRARKIESR
jgi:DDE superfamily endonuclease